jgi:hypothetical protein
MLALQGLFALTATLSVFLCLVPYFGAWQVLPLASAVGALLVLCIARHEQARPVALKIGSDGLSTWDQAGDLLSQGRVAGCAHWSDRLLILVLKPEQGGSHPLLLPADALSTSAFRTLAVLGRRAAGA